MTWAASDGRRVSAVRTLRPTSAASAPAAPGRRAPRAASAPPCGWTVLGAVLPGTGFLAAGRRGSAPSPSSSSCSSSGGAVWLATGGRRTAVRHGRRHQRPDVGRRRPRRDHPALDRSSWSPATACWCRRGPPRAARARRPLVARCWSPPSRPGRRRRPVALAQRDLIAGVFADDGAVGHVDDTPEPVRRQGAGQRPAPRRRRRRGPRGRPHRHRHRRQHRHRTPATTTLFSLPRNLENLPFPADSPLAEVYPDGFEAGTESESLLNAVYRNGPAAHPDILGPTDNPGADFLKLGVGEALGLHIDYYVLVNLDGFSRLVDALGGITVNVNYCVPVGGEPSTGTLPDDYIAPGPNQHMDGATALAFARGRFGLTDYDRMARQRCAINAIVDAADPMTLLAVPGARRTTKDIVSTDIPQIGARRLRRPGVPGEGRRASAASSSTTSVISPAYPDYDLIRQHRAGGAGAAVGARRRQSPRTAPGVRRPAGPGDARPPTPTRRRAGRDPVTDVGDACAYDPVHGPEGARRGQAADQAPAEPARRSHGGDLDQVAAGVVEDGGGHRAHLRRLLGEV